MDLYNHRVQKFTAEGKFLTAWGQKEKVNNVRSVLNSLFDEGLSGKFYFAAKIAVHPEGEVYVSASYNTRVQVFTEDGTFLRKWGGMGVWGGRFRVASDIAFDRKGRVYVADYYNNRVQIFDPDGKHMETWEDVIAPGDVWITDDNTIYVVEQGGGGGRVSVFSPEGELLSRFAGSQGGVMEAPHGICVDDEGSVYVAEIGGGSVGQRLQKFARV